LIRCKMESIAMGVLHDIGEIVQAFSEAVDGVLNKVQRQPQWLQEIQQHQTEACKALIEGIVRNCSMNGVVEVHAPINAIANALKRVGMGNDSRHRVVIAWNLLHIAQVAGWVVIHQSNTSTIVRITPSFAYAMYGKWFALAGTACPPMLDKPVQHTLKRRGGYKIRAFRKGVVRGKWSQVSSTAIAAANAMQNTPWVINKRVLAVANIVFADRIDPDVNGRERQLWNHNALLDLSNQIGKRIFYNPTYFEGSGRIFYSCDLLSPQANDLTRGLLLLGRRQRLNKHGWYWLAVHVANCFSGVGKARKLDKLPFNERVAWVRKNSSVLVAIANDPHTHRALWWNGIGKKAQTFQALAAAIAWDEALRTGYTQQPVMLDQTCSNYGHAAAMLRDSQLASLTNMAPSKSFSDFHSSVLANFQRVASETYDSDVVGSLTRNDVKSSSMVLGYGGTVKGIAGTMMGRKTWAKVDDKWKRVAEPGTLPARLSNNPSEHYKIAFNMATLAREAVIETAPAAFAVTNAIRMCIKVHREHGGDRFGWVSPSGFHVSLKSTKKVEDKIVAAQFLGGAQVKWYFFTDEMNWRKMNTATSPRFTHSFDAATLHICFANCEFDVVGVHDCIGCLPNHMTRLYRFFRESLVAIYESNPFKNFCDNYGVEIEQGDLDVSGVSRSFMLS
jgi:DNA-directed RNA polymerase